jgi:hypothetical protein
VIVSGPPALGQKTTFTRSSGSTLDS